MPRTHRNSNNSKGHNRFQSIINANVLPLGPGVIESGLFLQASGIDSLISQIANTRRTRALAKKRYTLSRRGNDNLIFPYRPFQISTGAPPKELARLMPPRYDVVRLALIPRYAGPELTQSIEYHYLGTETKDRFLDLIGKELPAASAPNVKSLGPINCCHIRVGILSSRSLYFPAPCILIDCGRQILAPSPPIRLSWCPYVIQSSRRRRATRRRDNPPHIIPKRKHSEYYAVIRGFYVTIPTIFSVW